MNEDQNETTDLLNEIAQGVLEKPDGLPDKFWDHEKGEVRIDALVKSYGELERRMSAPIDNDMDMDDDATRERFLRAAGVPKSPDEYNVSVKDNLFDPDPDMHTRLHAKGFNSDQVQEVYDLAVEKMVPMILDVAAEFQADREIERLKDHFGGQEQWQMASRQMLAYGQKNLSPEVLKGMSSSYEGIMALYQMMQSDEPQTLGAQGKIVSSNADKDLQSMMSDPKYWRDKDPAFIAKVTDGFKNLYTE
jgi:hypothetical protein